MEYGCIGEKLTHSFSAEIHGKLFDYTYELREIPKDGLDAFMRSRDFKAINVTIPYKEAVIPYLDEIGETARRIGAVNTIVHRDGRLYGDNTDFSGLCALLARAQIDLCGKKVLILGSGGTSKTAAAVAQHLGCAQLYRVSRSGRDGCITYAEAVSRHTDAAVMINTTPCGMFPHIGESAVDLAAFPALQGVADVVYNPLRSKLVCDARAGGIPAVGGLYMLVAQAAFAAERFVGQAVPQEKIDAIYRDLCRKKENIVLVGMPGSGKTTVGTYLATALGRELVDTDRLVEEQTGKTAAQLIAAYGEAVFRDREAEAVATAATKQNCVIATGGGAVLREQSVQLLHENGRIYFIDRPLEELPVTDDRPLSSCRQDLERRYRERYAIYCACCDRRIPVTGSAADTAQRIQEDFYDETTGD